MDPTLCAATYAWIARVVSSSRNCDITGNVAAHEDRLLRRARLAEHVLSVRDERIRVSRRQRRHADRVGIALVLIEDRADRPPRHHGDSGSALCGEKTRRRSFRLAGVSTQELVSRVLYGPRARPREAGRSFLWDARRRAPRAAYPGARADYPQTPLYVALFRMGLLGAAPTRRARQLALPARGGLPQSGARARPGEPSDSGAVCADVAVQATGPLRADAVLQPYAPLTDATSGTGGPASRSRRSARATFRLDPGGVGTKQSYVSMCEKDAKSLQCTSFQASSTAAAVS
jgi:hypothetical protein